MARLLLMAALYAYVFIIANASLTPEECRQCVSDFGAKGGCLEYYKGNFMALSKEPYTTSECFSNCTAMPYSTYCDLKTCKADNECGGIKYCGGFSSTCVACSADEHCGQSQLCYKDLGTCFPKISCKDANVCKGELRADEATCDSGFCRIPELSPYATTLKLKFAEAPKTSDQVSFFGDVFSSTLSTRLGYLRIMLRVIKVNGIYLSKGHRALADVDVVVDFEIWTAHSYDKVLSLLDSTFNGPSADGFVKGMTASGYPINGVSSFTMVKGTVPTTLPPEDNDKASGATRFAPVFFCAVLAVAATLIYM
jgi:hypothetical protein